MFLLPMMSDCKAFIAGKDKVAFGQAKLKRGARFSETFYGLEIVSFNGCIT